MIKRTIKNADKTITTIVYVPSIDSLRIRRYDEDKKADDEITFGRKTINAIMEVIMESDPR
jgi:ATP-dependent 26S proteasome regulatory subunit